MQDKALNIVISGNDAYLQKGYPLMMNLYELHQGHQVNVFAFSTDISKATITAYQRLAKNSDQHFFVYEIAPDLPFLEQYSRLQSGSLWGLDSTLWLLASAYLPHWVHSALFLDLDVLIFKNLLPLLYAAEMTKMVTYFGEDAIGRVKAYQGKLEGRRGLYGNSGFMRLDIDQMRQKVTSDWLISAVHQLLEIGTFKAFLKDYHVMGDQGFANYALYEQSDFEGHIKHFYHSMDLAQYQAFLAGDSEAYGVHFIHHLTPKPYDMDLRDISRSSFAEVYKQYAYYQAQALAVLEPQAAAGQLVTLLDFENQVFSGQKRLLMGFSASPYLPQSFQTYGDRPHTYQRVGTRKRHFMQYFLVKPIRDHQTYQVSVKLRVKGNTQQAIRLLAFNPQGDLTQELGVLADQDSELQLLTVEFEGRKEMISLGFSSTDFKQDAWFEVIAFNLSLIN